VVDLFAGIGYFSLPIALYTGPKEVIACELNVVSFRYLEENINLNKVGKKLRPLLGDCRDTAPEGVADRVVLGYLKDSYLFLPKALKVLKSTGGIIHYHDTVPNELLPKEPMNRLENACGALEYHVELLKYVKVKSYAPGISHVVLDARIHR
jgi:tRNA wybutosine-synthesizing protein 2